MAKETFYFSHDYNARTDEKTKALLRKHGVTGYGIYWCIVEDLYNNANALQKDYDGIAYDLRVQPEVVKSIINDFELFVINGDYFYSESVAKRLAERQKKSETAQKSAYKRWDNADAMQRQCKGNAIKERKEKKIKGNREEDTALSQSISTIWNNFATKNNLSQVLEINDKRKTAILARKKEPQFDLVKILEKIATSKFLLGDNDRGWKADFDFVFCSPNNYLKILEGKYNGVSNETHQRTNDRGKGAIDYEKYDRLSKLQPGT